jgi:hypothetical protein
MDIDQHVNSIVEKIVSDITSRVHEQIASVIEQRISETLSTIDFNSIVADKISYRLDAKIASMPIDTNGIQIELGKRVGKLAENLAEQVRQQSLSEITNAVHKHVNRVDFSDTFQSTIITAIQNKEVSFPEQSIPHSSINFADYTISGDRLIGGIATNFGSTGIDDKATSCQLTILDDVTVVENNLLTKDLTVKGTVTIEGDLLVTGKVPEDSALFVNLVRTATNNVRTSLDTNVFQGYADLIFNQIRDNGIDLSRVTVNGKELVNGSTLSNNVTASNLQKVGVLKELQVTGEASLSDTLYTSGKRVGVNTLQPAYALDLWDQEIEIGFGKLEKNVATITVPRTQNLVIGSNGQRNITILSDGSVSIDKLNLGTVVLYSSNLPPAKNEPKGTIVFNSNPTLGGPLGWVSLGDARWANFGFID